uniref:Uncharacterized protein n=1 Tax=Anopheles farauti TaxID=69004 RepID=A0A182QCN2_9DIPT
MIASASRNGGGVICSTSRRFELWIASTHCGYCMKSSIPVCQWLKARQTSMYRSVSSILWQPTNPRTCRVNSASVGSSTVMSTHDNARSGCRVPNKRTSFHSDRTLQMSMQSKYLQVGRMKLAPIRNFTNLELSSWAQMRSRSRSSSLGSGSELACSGMLSQGAPRHPELFPLGLRVDEVAPFVARQQIVDEDGGPAAVLAQLHLVRTLRADLLRQQHLLHEVLPLGENGEGAEQPAVAEHALADVGRQGRPEDGPRRGRRLMVASLAEDLVRPAPLGDWIAVEVGRRLRLFVAGGNESSTNACPFSTQYSMMLFQRLSASRSSSWRWFSSSRLFFCSCCCCCHTRHPESMCRWLEQMSHTTHASEFSYVHAGHCQVRFGIDTCIDLLSAGGGGGGCAASGGDACCVVTVAIGVCVSSFGIAPESTGAALDRLLFDGSSHWPSMSRLVASEPFTSTTPPFAAGRNDLHALQSGSTIEFFSVHLWHVQNSPFLSVISSTLQMLRSFEPPHATQASSVLVFTSVHFRHDHSFSSVTLVAAVPPGAAVFGQRWCFVSRQQQQHPTDACEPDEPSPSKLN